MLVEEGADDSDGAAADDDAAHDGAPDADALRGGVADVGGGVHAARRLVRVARGEHRQGGAAAAAGGGRRGGGVGLGWRERPCACASCRIVWRL